MPVYVTPIAYMLMRIRNAEREKLESITMPAEKYLVDIAKCLREGGYIKRHKVTRKITYAKSSGQRQPAKAEKAKLILYLNSVDEGKKIPKLRTLIGRVIKDAPQSEYRLLPSRIKEPVGKISAARRAAIRRAVIEVVIERMTGTSWIPGK